MELKLLKNHKKDNHLKQMIKMAKKSNTLIIASPFLSKDLGELLEKMPSINKVTLYTTLDRFEDTASKAVALFEFWQFCKDKNINLIIKVDEDLHGKVYLYYKDATPKGLIISSGNFTNNGLIKNHEFGVAIEDTLHQKEVADMLMSLSTYDLQEKELCVLCHEAKKYLEKHKEKKSERFQARKLIDKKPSVTQSGNQRFFIKPLGTSKSPFEKPLTLGDNDVTGFNKNPRTMNKGDIVICHAVGASNIVGYYAISVEEEEYDKWDEEDRWPWKLQVECHSSKFSREWWKYNLKTRELAEEFIDKNKGKHITAKGTDTLGALQWGSDKLEISKDFAQFLLERIESVQG